MTRDRRAMRWLVAGVAVGVTLGASAGIDRGGIGFGDVTEFGSIYVNGIEYDVSRASFVIEGQPGSEADLEVGQVVRVIADTSTGVASAVYYEDLVDGSVAAIDLAERALTVLGQSVWIESGTVFDTALSPPTLDALAPGDRIEVSGYFDSAGDIHATRVSLRPPGAPLEVTGAIENLDVATKRFDLKGLRVSYATGQLINLTEGAPRGGDWVEVTGSTFTNEGVLRAVTVRGKRRGITAEEGQDISLAGLVTRYLSPLDFEVAHTPVTIDAQTAFVDGTALDLAADRRLLIDGVFQANGVIMAGSIEFGDREEDDEFELAGPVQAFDRTDGSLTVLGLTVRADRYTRMEDHSQLRERRFGLDDLQVGDYVTVRASGQPVQRSLTARALLRGDAGLARVRGRPRALGGERFDIGGIEVSLTHVLRARALQGAPVDILGEAIGDRLIATEVVLHPASGARGTAEGLRMHGTE